MATFPGRMACGGSANREPTRNQTHDRSHLGGVATPHDALFKAIYSAPEDAAGLLRPLLPAALTAAIDWSSLRLAPGSFVDDALRHLHADLLFEVHLRGREAFLFLLAEHKSRGDRFTALHLLRYIARIWARWREHHPRARFLPHVVPLVVHHGRRRWRAPTAMAGLLDPRGLDAAEFAALVRCEPDFEFAVDDLVTADDQAIRSRGISGLAQLALVCMRSLRNADAEAALAILEQWLHAVARALAAEGGVDRIAVIWSYVLQVTDLPLDRLGPILARVGPEIESTLMSTADKLRAEGKNVGKAEGKADLILRLLTTRFGAIPPATRARVRAAAVSDLDRWADAILTAPTLEAVFGGE